MLGLVYPDLPSDNPFSGPVRLMVWCTAAALGCAVLTMAMVTAALVLNARRSAHDRRFFKELHDLFVMIREFYQMGRARHEDARAAVESIPERVAGEVARKTDEVKAAVEAVPERVVEKLQSPPSPASP